MEIYRNFTALNLLKCCKIVSGGTVVRKIFIAPILISLMLMGCSGEPTSKNEGVNQETQQISKKDQTETPNKDTAVDDEKKKFQVDPSSRQVNLDENFLQVIATGKMPGIVFGIDATYEEIHKWWGKPSEIAYNEGANAHYYKNPNIAFTENYEDTTKVAQIEVYKDFGMTSNELKKLLKVAPDSEGKNDMTDNYEVDYTAGDYEVWFTSDTAEGNINRVTMRKKP